jgi:t-SNARE complex subunit (syntaxin)
MLPQEYRQLCQLDPLAELAAQKGKADAEAEMAGHLREAARAGDAKAALAVLQNRHDWVAKQQVQIDVAQQISVIGALEQAQSRVIEGVATQITQQPPTELLSRTADAAEAAR